MINIITSFYICRLNSELNNERNNELQQCLKYNIENPLIEKIHLFLDDEDAHNYIQHINSNKIKIIEIGKKPLYSDLFAYANNNLQNKICMITNSDIYLKECDLQILNAVNYNTVYALTRYEHDMSCPLIQKYQGSHDSFIFRSPLSNSFIDKVQHVQHVWGSENVLLYELAKANILIYNPCYQIKIVHLHKSDLRENNRPRINYQRSLEIPPIFIKLL